MFTHNGTLDDADLDLLFLTTLQVYPFWARFRLYIDHYRSSNRGYS